MFRLSKCDIVWFDVFIVWSKISCVRKSGVKIPFILSKGDIEVKSEVGDYAASEAPTGLEEGTRTPPLVISVVCALYAELDLTHHLFHSICQSRFVPNNKGSAS